MTKDDVKHSISKKKKEHFCECGCGIKIPTFDKQGRPRRFVFGHQRRNAVVSEETRMKMSKNNGNLQGRKHNIKTKNKISKSLMGHKVSEEAKQKISKSKKGFKHTEESKRKMRIAKQNISDETRRRISEGQKNISEEIRLKMNKARSGKNHYNWQGGISYGKYCPLFNEKKKEEIRNQFYRKCLLCDKTEEENGKKLDVHHFDYNKGQGCNGHEWRLVPLCRSCHMKTGRNRELYERRIKIILEVI